MRVIFENEKHKNLYFIDCEYDIENLKQIALIHFKKIEDSIYELDGSLNIYIKDNEPLSNFFTSFTAIPKWFFDQYGISLRDAKMAINDFLEERDDILFIGHGIKGDSHVLFKNGILLDKQDLYCTWENSKDLLPKNESYTVETLAGDCGWFMTSPHDAFNDAWALVPIFSKLKELEYEQREMS